MGASADGTGRTGGPGRITVLVEDAHVRYRVYADRRPQVRELLTGRGSTREFREIHAVRGVSLQARAGEAVGLIGRNGSGKSTLLQAVAGLLPVNEGRVLASSQPSLLGVGAALQPGVSGRRNILLGGLALGMPKREIEERLDGIVAFAGLEDSIDLPMRTYSSGMKARLHFSIATAVAPEILLIDEALAVGDAIFQRRSEERVRELTAEAGTVFLVSHSMGAVKEMCERVVWLEAGQIVADGAAEDVIPEYEAYMKRER